ncbi:MAG: hypothetical protein ABW184_00245 [Sphingobium sp.]
MDGEIVELQQRGLFRWKHEGDMLRDHLGLPRLPGRFFDMEAQEGRTDSGTVPPLIVSKSR